MITPFQVEQQWLRAGHSIQSAPKVRALPGWLKMLIFLERQLISMQFQEDLYPDTQADIPAITAAEW